MPTRSSARPGRTAETGVRAPGSRTPARVWMRGSSERVGHRTRVGEVAGVLAHPRDDAGELFGVAVVEDLVAARSLVTAHRGITAVTRRGDLLGGRSAYGGAGDAPSVLHMMTAETSALPIFPQP